MQSAQHAALGGLAALPLAGLKAAGWRDDVQESLPLLENIHEREVVSMQPILTGMTPQQVASLHLSMNCMPASWVLAQYHWRRAF